MMSSVEAMVESPKDLWSDFNGDAKAWGVSKRLESEELEDFDCQGITQSTCWSSEHLCTIPANWARKIERTIQYFFNKNINSSRAPSISAFLQGSISLLGSEWWWTYPLKGDLDVSCFPISFRSTGMDQKKESPNSVVCMALWALP